MSGERCKMPLGVLMVMPATPDRLIDFAQRLAVMRTSRHRDRSFRVIVTDVSRHRDRRFTAS
jgi:hypothetical protein